jgi:hypothetical protein
MENEWESLLGRQEAPSQVQQAAASFYRWAEPGSSWPYNDLYVAYSRYCKARGEKRASEYFWVKALKEVGMQYSSIDRHRRWTKP